MESVVVVVVFFFNILTKIFSVLSLETLGKLRNKAARFLQEQ